MARDRQIITGLRLVRAGRLEEAVAIAEKQLAGCDDVVLRAAAVDEVWVASPRPTPITLAAAAVAGADVLWDQSEADMGAPGFFNTVSGSPPFGLTMHTVNDVVVEQMWTVTTISTYWSILDTGWANLTEGHLHVFPKTGALPGDADDPTASLVVPMTATVDANFGILVAGGLELVLEPGEYWIGITPIVPSGPMGPEVHLSSTVLVGDDSASFDPYGMPAAWFNFNPGYDATILIEGETTVATEAKSWSDIKTLYR